MVVGVRGGQTVLYKKLFPFVFQLQKRVLSEFGVRLHCIWKSFYDNNEWLEEVHCNKNNVFY